MTRRTDATVDLSVFDARHAHGDGIPIIAEPFANQFFEPGTSRLALRCGEREVYVARGKEPGFVALVLVDHDAGSAAGSCCSLESLRSHGALTATVRCPEVVAIAGLISDDVAAVQVGNQAAVIGVNAFLCETTEVDPTITLVSAAGIAQLRA